MARSNSIINVSIIGDAAKLIGAVGKADAATGGLVQSAAKVAGASIAVKKGFDLIGDSLAEADRRGDAIQRLERSIGKIDTAKLVETSDAFAGIGGSSQDILELEAAYADIATSAGIGAPDIAANAEAMAATALAAAQIHDADPAAILDAMGKAVGGQLRGLKDYGVDLTEAAVQQRALKDTGKDNPKLLTDTELAAARAALILDSYAGVLADVTTGTGDVNIKQDELGAKFETVAGKIGAGLEGPIGGLLDWVNDMVDAIPGAIDGWSMLGDRIDGVLDAILTPLKLATDAASNFLGLLGDIGNFKFGSGNTPFIVSPGRSDRNTNDAVNREQERNGLGR